MGTDFHVRTYGRLSNPENSVYPEITTGNKRVQINELSLNIIDAYNMYDIIGL